MDTNDEDVRVYLGALAPYRAKLGHRLVLLESLNEAELAAIGTGIVLVIATWAPQPRLALRTITRLLDEIEFSEVLLYVVAIEKIDINLTDFGNIRVGGWGETIWLQNGQIVYTGSAYSEADLDDLRAATRMMLLAPTQIMNRKRGV
jgi:hypothetical protein